MQNDGTNMTRLAELRLAMDKTAEPRYRDYLRRYKGPGKPMSKEDWEAKVLGKGKGTGKLDEGEKGESKKDYDKGKDHAENTKDTKSTVKSLKQKAKDSGKVETHTETTKSEGKGGTNEHKQTVRALPNGKAVVTWTDTFTPKGGGKAQGMGSYSVLADINDDGSLKMFPKTQKKHKTEDEANNAAKDLVSGQEKGSSGKKDEPKKDEKPESKKDKKPAPKKDAPKAKSYKKSYPTAATSIMDKHEMTDEDADQVKAWKKDKPVSGKPISDAEKLRRFLAKAKPETKERLKGMSPAEFVKLLGVLTDDEGGEGGGKKASVRFANSADMRSFYDKFSW